MNLDLSRLTAISVHRVVFVAMTLVLASVGVPSAEAQAQQMAIPPCAEVFDLGAASQSCLRIVNVGSPDQEPVDVYLGDAVIAEDVEYGQATEFTALPADSQQLRIVRGEDETTEATYDISEQLQPGGAYQLTVADPDDEALPSWLSDVDVSPLPLGEARIRFIHASSDLGAVDVSVAEETTPVQGLEYGAVTNYAPFAAGEYPFLVRQSGQDTLLLQTPETVMIEEGMNYDLFIIGQSETGTLAMVMFAAEVGVSGDATPAAMVTPVVAIGATPIMVTPGAQEPAPTPPASPEA